MSVSHQLEFLGQIHIPPTHPLPIQASPNNSTITSRFVTGERGCVPPPPQFMARMQQLVDEMDRKVTRHKDRMEDENARCTQVPALRPLGPLLVWGFKASPLWAPCRRVDWPGRIVFCRQIAPSAPTPRNLWVGVPPSSWCPRSPLPGLTARLVPMPSLGVGFFIFLQLKRQGVFDEHMAHTHRCISLQIDPETRDLLAELGAKITTMTAEMERLSEDPGPLPILSLLGFANPSPLRSNALFGQLLSTYLPAHNYSRYFVFLLLHAGN